MQKQNVVSLENRFMERQELELINAVRGGDRHAFQRLYGQHGRRVYALCYRLTGDRGMAEDATQEVFIQVWRKIREFRFNSRFSTWLHAVAVNITLSHMRKQRGWFSRFISSEREGVPPAAEEMDTENLDLDRFIARLPERARVVFVLYAVEGYRHEEISARLNIAVGTSKAQYHRARGLLKEWMGS